MTWHRSPCSHSAAHPPLTGQSLPRLHSPAHLVPNSTASAVQQWLRHHSPATAEVQLSKSNWQDREQGSYQCKFQLLSRLSQTIAQSQRSHSRPSQTLAEINSVKYRQHPDNPVLSPSWAPAESHPSLCICTAKVQPSHYTNTQLQISHCCDPCSQAIYNSHAVKPLLRPSKAIAPGSELYVL